MVVFLDQVNSTPSWIKGLSLFFVLVSPRSAEKLRAFGVCPVELVRRNCSQRGHLPTANLAAGRKARRQAGSEEGGKASR